MHYNKYRRLIWQIDYFVIPMLPILLSILIKLTVTQRFDLAMFRASDFAASSSMLSFSLSHCILNSVRALDDEKLMEAEFQAKIFNILTVMFLILYSIIEAYSVIEEYFQVGELRAPLKTLELIAFFSTPLIFMYSNMVQKTFRLG